MSYEVVFPSERVERAFQKALSKIPAGYQEAIVAGVRALASNPSPEGKRTKKLTARIEEIFLLHEKPVFESGAKISPR